MALSFRYYWTTIQHPRMMLQMRWINCHGTSKSKKRAKVVSVLMKEAPATANYVNHRKSLGRRVSFYYRSFCRTNLKANSSNLPRRHFFWPRVIPPFSAPISGGINPVWASFFSGLIWNDEIIHNPCSTSPTAAAVCSVEAAVGRGYSNTHPVNNEAVDQDNRAVSVCVSCACDQDNQADLRHSPLFPSMRKVHVHNLHLSSCSCHTQNSKFTFGFFLFCLDLGVLFPAVCSAILLPAPVVVRVYEDSFTRHTKSRCVPLRGKKKRKKEKCCCQSLWRPEMLKRLHNISSLSRLIKPVGKNSQQVNKDMLYFPKSFF